MTLLQRTKVAVTALNKDKTETWEEYERNFSGKYEVARNLVMRLRRERALRPYIIEMKWPVTTRPFRCWPDFALAEDVDYTTHDPKVRIVIPAVFKRRSIPKHLGTESTWRAGGRRIRWDAVTASWIAGKSIGGGLPLYHVDETHMVPQTMLKVIPTEAKGFRKVLQKQPRDVTAWLVLADWCGEHGHAYLERDIRRYWDWYARGIVD